MARVEDPFNVIQLEDFLNIRIQVSNSMTLKRFVVAVVHSAKPLQIFLASELRVHDIVLGSTLFI